MNKLDAERDRESTRLRTTQQEALTPPGERVPRPAVGWLLGPELIGRLRRIFAKRRDPRKWMTFFPGFLHDETRFRDGRVIHKDAQEGAPYLTPWQKGAEERPPSAVLDPTRSGLETPGHSRQEDADGKVTYPAEAGSVWFDYISDTGDSSDATYAIAYACQIDLELVVPPGAPLPTGRSQPPPTLRRWREHDREKHDRPGNLPRGQFLFVGGDTAYHVADHGTVHERVGLPFKWANADLGSDVAQPAGAPPRIYGIPGNHDWYDDLCGFSLVFRRGDQSDAVDVGFQRTQLGSYAAIQLPHKWQLWGMDIDESVGIDKLQRLYFESLARPQRLILCTPSPPVTFHQEIASKEHARALGELKLPETYRSDSESLPQGTCRLDLSGDVHHYARYASTHAGDAGGDADHARYMAVVSGLGGAFHHPSFTRAGDREPVVTFPTPEKSRESIAPALLHPLSTLVGSWLRAFPILFALVLGGAAAAGGGATWLWRTLIAALPGVDDPGSVGEREELARATLLLGVLLCAGALVALAVRLFRMTEDKQAEDPKRRRPWYQATFGSDPGQLFDIWRTQWPATLAVIAAVALCILFSRCPDAPRRDTAALDTLTVVLVLAAVFVGPWAAGWKGGTHLPFRRKPPLLVLGLVHGVAQVVTPLFCVLLAFVSWTAPIGAVATAGLTVLGTWMLLLGSRLPFRAKRTTLVAGLALIAWLGGLALILVASESTSLGVDLPWWALLVLSAAGGLMAMALSTVYFAWYLAIAALLDGHNNEAGGAARVTSFRQLVRFHLDAAGLTGYVISVEDDTAYPGSPVTSGGEHLQFRLVDVFTVGDGRT